MLKNSLEKRFNMWFDLANPDEREVKEFKDFGDHVLLFKVFQTEAINEITYKVDYSDDEYGGMVEISVQVKINTDEVIQSRPILGVARCLDALTVYGDNVFRHDFMFDPVSKNTHFYLMADNEKEVLDLIFKFEDYGIRRLFGEAV